MTNTTEAMTREQYTKMWDAIKAATDAWADKAIRVDSAQVLVGNTPIVTYSQNAIGAAKAQSCADHIAIEWQSCTCGTCARVREVRQ